jgi:ABC-type transport system involved in cytochrome c biogenesis permease subunit
MTRTTGVYGRAKPNRLAFIPVHEMTTATLKDVDTPTRSPAPPSRSATFNPLVPFLRPFSSLTLTVVLLALAFFLIFAGTWAQRFNDVWHVQQRYFHSFGCVIGMNLFLPEQIPQNAFWGAVVKALRPIRIPMVGGYTLIALMLVNLLAAHATRFKPKRGDVWLIPLLAAMLFLPERIIPNAPPSWLAVTLGGVPLFTMLAYTPLLALFSGAVAWLHGKRTGIILTHLALIILLAGELITSQFAVESRMRIDEGQTINYSYDLRETELAVTDTSAGADHDRVVAFPKSLLAKGAVLKHPSLPFEIKLDDYFKNSSILGPAQARQQNIPDRATAGEFKGQLVAVEAAQVSGVGSEASAVDAPAAYATLSANGQSLGTYVFAAPLQRAQSVTVGDKAYEIALRFRRYYRPYSLHLKDFAFDRYAGTDTPKNYSALVQLIDPSHGVNREVRIWMNHPLRYAGETFFQSSFDPTNETTTELQVVKNPGERFPYIACALGAIGLVVHFGITLLRFIGRSTKEGAQSASVVIPAGSRSQAGGKNRGNGARNIAATSMYTLVPRGRAALWVPMVVTAVLAVYLMSLFARQPKNEGTYDLNAFARIPVSFDGRQQPLDSLARNALRGMSGKGKVQEEIKDPSAVRQFLGMTTRTSGTALEWLNDLWSMNGKALDATVFRIDHEDVKRLIAPSDPQQQKAFVERKLFSFNEIIAARDRIMQQLELIKDVPVKDRDLFQTKVAELVNKVNLFIQIDGRNVMGLFLVPPEKPTGEWRRLGDVVQESQTSGRPADALARELAGVLQAQAQHQADEFNGGVRGYLARLDAKFPAVTARTQSEVLFNRVDPFTQSFVFYILVFLLVIFSWLVGGGTGFTLRRTAWWVLLLTLTFHSAALAWRIYLTGRPPVTNLYSSAIFIAWGAAILASGLEYFFRNGIGTLTAAVVGGISLLVSINLADGREMAVLQAVLDTNFWLATHVVIITLGYAATFLAGILAVVYVVGGLATTALDRRAGDLAKVLSRMVYGILCFALLFSFVGTVLGGIWADQSWGRFWGWDPKENGAALIVLWNALILHARWGGLVRERGLMNLAIFGNVVTAWSWFGTNMLGIGLHAYGFIESALFWLGLFILSQLLLIVAGSLPLRLWRSFAGQAHDEGRALTA